MVDVPEYLLERSRQRRAALGLASTGAGPTPPPSDEASEADQGAAEPVAASTAVEPAAAAPAAPAVPEAPGVPALPTYIGSPPSKTGVPRWMIPVLFLLPFWAIVYLGAFGTSQSQATLTPIQLGGQVYGRQCASCHGAQGQGGSGPALAGGEAAVTFPDEAQHVAWVETGSAAVRGQPYGDPNRPGGPRTAKTGAMPGFSGRLSPAEIQAVVAYERTALR